MTDVTVADLIGSAADQSPEAFRQTFDQLMHDKVVAALDVRKQEVAAGYFADEVDADEEITDEIENEEEDGQDTETDA
jgi:phosphoribosylformimino-5-aminoimidazole carboxamide ribonucleotide (ProFAR) isomerase